jgi:uncharacterized protein (TIGR03437 family)
MRFVLFFFFITTLAIAGDFTTSLGDSYPYMISAITTDSAGNTYVVGSRALGGSLTAAIGDLPQMLSIYTPFYSPADVFVTKLDPNGQVMFTDTFAGKGVDQGIAIALDPSGNIYIAGTTTSNDFPLSKALQTQPSTYGSGFIIKLTNDGSTILYSTYFGGVLGGTSVNAMTTDVSGNLYLTGETFASDFPHTAGMPFASIQPGQSGYVQATSAAFVAALDPAGDKILFAGAVGGTQTRCGGGGHDCSKLAASTAGISVALDASRNVYFGGNTNTTDLPSTSGAFLKQGMGAFAGKIAAGGTGLAYLTYLGSAQELAQGPLYNGANLLSSFTADAAGNVYLAGNTGDPNFPATPGAYQSTFGGGPIDEFGLPKSRDGFVAKLKPDGSAFVWATYLGGAGDAAVTAIAVDAAGNVCASGTTKSPSFPNAQGWTQGGDFLVEFNPAGSALSYSALYPTGTVDQSIALDPSGLIHLAGLNGLLSAVAPAAAPVMEILAFQNAFGGSTTARISPAEVISIYGPSIGPATAASAASVNGFYPTTFSGVQVQINGVNAPLLYVSANQINAVVPMGLITGAGATVRVINGNVISPGYPVWVVTSTAQAFPSALNQDGTLNSKTPAKSNSVVTVYATGLQWSYSSPLSDGQVATMAQDFCSGRCTASANGFPGMTVLYGGTAPGIVAGVTQFNIKLGTIIAPLWAPTITLTGPGGTIDVTVLVAGSLP